MQAFNSAAFGFIIFGKWNGAPLYLIVHVFMWLIAVWRSDKMHALLAQRCYQPLRWTTDLCMVMNLEYNVCMTVSREDTSFSIACLNSTMEDALSCSPPCLASYNSLAMHSFSTIKNRTLGFNICSSSIGQCCWMPVHIRHYHCLFKLCRRYMEIWSRYSAWLHNSVLWLIERYVVHLYLEIVFKDLCVSLIDWD